MNNLTKIAALPGSGAGAMAALPAEVGKRIDFREQVVKWKVAAMNAADPEPAQFAKAGIVGMVVGAYMAVANANRPDLFDTAGGGE